MNLRATPASALLRLTPLRHRATRKRLVHMRRRLYEAAGSSRYSRPGHGGIDGKLERYLPTTGVFVEAGANDGYTWSNTYYLERCKGWSGVLIEGIPALSRECRRQRPRSQVFNCALVSPGFDGERVTMTYADLRSLVSGSDAAMEEMIRAERQATYEVAVPARTLDDVLREAGVGHVDFMSLDLEGFETPALTGLDLQRHGPDWLLVEVLGGGGRQGVESVIGERYEAVEELTQGDVLYRRRA
jgi:FkbM family methyltransferase